MAKDYRIALRPISNKLHPNLMDDIVVKDVAMFRAERMDHGNWWVALYLNDSHSEELTFSVHATKSGRIVWAVTELPEGDHVYEDGGPPAL